MIGADCLPVFQSPLLRSHQKRIHHVPLQPALRCSLDSHYVSRVLFLIHRTCHSPITVGRDRRRAGSRRRESSGERPHSRRDGVSVQRRLHLDSSCWEDSRHRSLPRAPGAEDHPKAICRTHLAHRLPGTDTGRTSVYYLQTKISSSHQLWGP